LGKSDRFSVRGCDGPFGLRRTQAIVALSTMDKGADINNQYRMQVPLLVLQPPTSPAAAELKQCKRNTGYN